LIFFSVQNWKKLYIPQILAFKITRRLYRHFSGQFFKRHGISKKKSLLCAHTQKKLKIDIFLFSVTPGFDSIFRPYRPIPGQNETFEKNLELAKWAKNT